MNRIRKLFCTTDPMVLTVVIILVGIILAEVIVLGAFKFFGILLIGCILAALVVAIGWLVYKIIVLVQSSLCSNE